MTGREAQRTDAADVAFVCSGNRARSPLAEALLARKVAPARLAVTSYGTLELGAPPALANAIAAGESLGVDLRAHRARTLRPGVLRGSRLVVGFEPSHLAAAVEIGRADADRVFMLLDLPALLDGIDPPPPGAGDAARVDWVAERMNERRTSGHGAGASLSDPFGEPMRAFTETARIIDALTSLLAAELASEL